MVRVDAISAVAKFPRIRTLNGFGVVSPYTEAYCIIAICPVNQRAAIGAAPLP
jgi:hypothetical protein